MKKKIVILTGDPNSINLEIIHKFWKKINKSLKQRIYFISNEKLIKHQFHKLKLSLKTTVVKDIFATADSNKLKIIDLKLDFKDPFNVPFNAASKFVKASLNLGHKIAQRREVAGLINCAIDKKLLGTDKIGVTEYLARKCKVKKDKEVMIIGNKKLSVCPITTHIDVREISKRINSKIIINKLITIESWYKYKYKRKPKIGILGLNPHNAELRKYSEEKKFIIPAIKKLKKKGIKVDGPLVSDTVFISAYKNYDIIVGMYHDQVLSPFKTLFKFNAINITLGLKYLRVSPDHGTARDLIGKNKANAKSILECLNFLNKFS
tara:strand:- start:5632 stop:6594 length:963 start_codon:yes stop_codon:yes gene_type:complete